jgi:hypothetical protein
VTRAVSSGGNALRSHYAFAISPTARRSPAGVLASILLHLLIGTVLFLRIREDFARVLDAGRQGPGPQGGGGGGAGRVAYITLPAPTSSPRVAVTVEAPRETPPPVPVTPTPTPPPVIPPPVPEEQPVAVAAPSAATTGDSVAGTGPGQGGGEGGGTGGGAGPGTGPGRGPGEGTGGGEGGLGRAPRPRYELIPPQDPPKELRGKEVRILFAIDAEGKVRRVTFDPEIPRGKFAERLKETMQGYRFHPALGPDGRPVPGSFEYTMTLF